MRESRKTERMQLPRDSTEVWLDSQKPSRGVTKHRNPPEDSFEAWMEKRVVKTIRHRKVAE